MIKVQNVILKDDIITMDCLKNGDANEVYHIILNRDFEPSPETERNPYVLRAIAMARRYHKKTGTIPREFISAWH